ncbi:acyl-CoA dehydrogenase family protein [Oleiphilus sp. HI0125]|uniref:acyl-CoA dehydrogenase family protein n=4 Tax=unclassified Oleiphilus TaxID=2631174 RepID=UPI000A94BBC5|nr:acyl-CoA dehydrogenase family protein [Oleiphilus sp. HI0125]
MNHYKAPMDNINFVLFEVLKAGNIANIEQFADATEDMQRAVLEEAAKLAENVLQPINASGDREGCVYDPEAKTVKTPSGFKEAYKTYQEGGWSGLASPVEHGGQGLPHFLKVVVDEMCCSTNLSFGMYPGLSHGSIDALTLHGNEHQQSYYLPKLIAGEWTGTMCLTEPHCGTDLGLIKTKAEPQADGSVSITGNKVWITGGDHDMTDNIIHLVLAKLPDAPAGSKGISLFLVPKFLEDGSRNPAFCGGLEHKMGIKGSATCVMNFEGAKGWLVGKENEGLKCMFTMMNAARIMVGMQGLGLAETGYQVSLAFAKDRLQSRSLTGPRNPDGPADPIIVHPDVRRMLLKQKVLIEAGRAMAYWAAYQQDLAHAAPEEADREKADDLFQIMTPIVKSFLTDEGYFSADAALQSMGGNGYTQDWPVEQLLRDGRIARIYEGTNGIQALDLIGRKLTMRGGRLPRTYIAAMNDLIADALPEHKKQAEQFIAKLTQTLMGLVKTVMSDPEEAGAAATPLLRMFALTSLAVMWAKMAKQTQDNGTKSRFSEDFLEGKVKAANHFYRLYLPEMDQLAADVEAGKATLMDLAEAEF